MAEDDRAVEESSSSRNLQSWMELYLCRGCLQLGPPAESNAAGDVSRSRVRSAEMEKGPQTLADVKKLSRYSQRSPTLDSISSRIRVFPQPARGRFLRVPHPIPRTVARGTIRKTIHPLLPVRRRRARACLYADGVLISDQDWRVKDAAYVLAVWPCESDKNSGSTGMAWPSVL
jgi:hypothetical protein